MLAHRDCRRARGRDEERVTGAKERTNKAEDMADESRGR